MFANWNEAILDKHENQVEITKVGSCGIGFKVRTLTPSTTWKF